MPEQTITLTLDVPFGYELTGEFRRVKLGEQHLRHDMRNGADRWCFDYESNGNYFVLRPVPRWQPPDWLPDGCWVWRCFNGSNWYVGAVEPVEINSGLRCSPKDYSSVPATALAAIHNTTFVPPPVDKIQVKR